MSTRPTTEQSSTSAADERSLGQIVSDVSSDLSTLLRQELELAKQELKEEMRKTGKGAGMLGGAGIAGHLLLLFLSLSAMFVLAKMMGPGTGWLALSALIVALVWAVVTAVLATQGRKKLQEANPQLPKTQQTIKEDVEWAKAQKS